MASKRMLVTIALVALAISPVLAKEYVVGDGKGWTAIQPDDEFENSIAFFKYKVVFHEPVKVDDASFKKNVSAPETTETLASGNNVIRLEKPGKQIKNCTIAVEASTAK
ncbi:unnamed protein product [Dovyalis caffra]|uniref:Uncharacterized protein n=1 Tax=Dovyalis caffra TaxID=77055 RepID=A0AAV1RGP6_9ROSI|nr:unnamed protein product [Dovyalis caffra]